MNDEECGGESPCNEGSYEDVAHAHVQPGEEAQLCGHARMAFTVNVRLNEQVLGVSVGGEPDRKHEVHSPQRPDNPP
ncbi:MAG: hypothetical protein II877_06210 [Synergistaceae bacterium]|nr:hypothetical protein [Synergistaceae bacterium]